MRKEWRKMAARVCRRYVGGGPSGGNQEAEKTPAEASAPTQEEAGKPSAAPKTAGAEETPRTYSQTEYEAGLERARQEALSQARQEEENARDFEKMTPEQKVARLQAQLEEEKLAGAAGKLLEEAGLPPAALAFVKGKDLEETRERLQAFQELVGRAVQAGVEARFRETGYTPRTGGSSPGSPPSTGDPFRDAVSQALNLK